MEKNVDPLVPHMGFTVVPPLLKPGWLITPVMDCLKILAEATMNCWWLRSLPKEHGYEPGRVIRTNKSWESKHIVGTHSMISQSNIHLRPFLSLEFTKIHYVHPYIDCFGFMAHSTPQQTMYVLLVEIQNASHRPPPCQTESETNQNDFRTQQEKHGKAIPFMIS